MNIRRLVCIGLVAFLSACSKEDFANGGPKSNVDAVSNQAANVPEAIEDSSDSGGWASNIENSAIDGRIVHAKRNFVQEGRGAWFSVDIACVEATKDIRLFIESYQGDPKSPSVGNPFSSNRVVVNLLGVTGEVPVGRAKPNGLGVRPLSDLFAISNTVSNRIILQRPRVEDDVVRLPKELQDASSREINVARVVRDMLPLSLELNNMSGDGEIVIDPSPHVLQVLRSCGGDNDLVSPDAVARLAMEKQKQEEQKKADEEQAAQKAAQEEKAREEQIRLAAGQQCRNYGDCTKDFSDEMSAFNAEIDAIYSVPANHGFLCSARGTRNDLVNFANQHGLDAARTFVQQSWCKNQVRVEK